MNSDNDNRNQLLAKWLPTPGNIIFTLLVVFVLFWANSAGAIPFLAANGDQSGILNTSSSTIAYQGYLVDSGGNPVNESINITFRLYNVASSGTAVWQESQTVSVNDGLLSVLLGNQTPITLNILSNNSDLWLGITVGTDQEMTPREKIASAPYAILSNVADGSITTIKIANNSVTTTKIANGSITTSKIAPNFGLVPSGAIVMWSGSIASIPSDWVLCNGANGTPDLRNRFVVGAGSSYAVGATGGVNTVDLSHSHTVDPHTHGAGTLHARIYISTAEGQIRYRGVTGEDYNTNKKANISGIADLSTGVSAATDVAGTSSAASPGTNSQLSATTENRPPYYSLAYICKQ